jgi:hypothetical protein
MQNYPCISVLPRGKIISDLNLRLSHFRQLSFKNATQFLESKNPSSNLSIKVENIISSFPPILSGKYKYSRLGNYSIARNKKQHRFLAPIKQNRIQKHKLKNLHREKKEEWEDHPKNDKIRRVPVFSHIDQGRHSELMAYESSDSADSEILSNKLSL